MGSSSTDWIAWVRGVAGMDDGTVVAGFWKQYWGFLYWSYPQRVSFPPQSVYPIFLASAESRQLQMEGQEPGEAVITMAGVDVGESVFVVVVVGVGVGVFGVVVAAGGW